MLCLVVGILEEGLLVICLLFSFWSVCQVHDTITHIIVIHSTTLTIFIIISLIIFIQNFIPNFVYADSISKL